jgi:hypothetical protein
MHFQKLNASQLVDLAHAARRNPTIITGCALWLPFAHKHAYGDLWAFGTGMVLNAVIEPPAYPGDCNTKWFTAAPDLDQRVIRFGPEAYFLERRGVIAFDAALAEFNLRAYKHILEGISLS